MPNEELLYPEVKNARAASGHTSGLRSDNAIICFIWLFFAVVLAIVSYSHQIYLDEAQAWLMAGQSHGLFDLFKHLRYEGHPALWYLLLYIPAHLSGDVGWMKFINYVLALTMAWLILSARNTSMNVRILLIFSVHIFFYLGVVERSYMLAGVLLVAAGRCFSEGSHRRWWGVLFLCLAINTHAMAIPVVIGIFAWFYWLAPNFTVKDSLAKLREKRFLASSAAILFAVLIAFLTVRPMPDIYHPELERVRLSRLGYLALGTGDVWHHYFFYPAGWFSPEMRQKLVPHDQPSALAVMLTLVLAGLALWALPTRLARLYMLTVSLLWIAVVSVTIYTPSAFHSSFLFVAYLIPLIAKIPGDSGSDSVGSGRTLKLLLSVQVCTAILYFAMEVSFPFSGSKATADWLKKSGLDNRPLVIEPDLAAPALLAYSRTNTAYFPACRCQGSFVDFRKGREVTRHVTASELQTIRNEYGLSPILIVSSDLGEPNYEKLGLHLIYTSPHGWFWSGENLSAYGESDIVSH